MDGFVSAAARSIGCFELIRALVSLFGVNSDPPMNTDSELFTGCHEKASERASPVILFKTTGDESDRR